MEDQTQLKRRRIIENKDFAPAPSPRISGINDLDEHVRGKIFNYLEQTEVPKVSLVCKQWTRQDIDEYYEFEWTLGYNKDNYYDDKSLEDLRIGIQYIDKNYDKNTVFKPFTRKCTKCNILWHNFPKFDENFQFMKYPTYLKKLRILGPIEPQYLQHIVSSSIKLEILEIEGAGDFPTILSLAQTPGLARLTNLRKICSKPDARKRTHSPGPLVLISTFMDCHFPKLEYFYIDLFKNRTIHPALVWKFLKVHASTLRYFVFWDAFYQDPVPLTLSHFELEDFGTLELLSFKELNVMGNYWSPIWAIILSQQSILETLSFTFWNVPDDWGRVPWVHFQAPIINSRKTISSVDLSHLNMSGSAHRFLDLSIFRSCLNLTSLSLGGSGRDSGPREDKNIHLVINGNDLPTSLYSLQFTSLPILSSELILIIERLENLMTLELWSVGKTDNLGVTSSVLHAISGLKDLERLDIMDFNTSDPEDNEKIRVLIELLGKEFDGSETRLWLNNAHLELEVVRS